MPHDYRARSGLAASPSGTALTACEPYPLAMLGLPVEGGSRGRGINAAGVCRVLCRESPLMRLKRPNAQAGGAGRFFSCTPATWRTRGLGQRPKVLGLGISLDGCAAAPRLLFVLDVGKGDVKGNGFRTIPGLVRAGLVAPVGAASKPLTGWRVAPGWFVILR